MRLSLNGGGPLSIAVGAPTFAFPPLLSGTHYTVTVNADGVSDDYLRNASYELVVANEVVEAHLHLEPLYDPTAARVKA